MVPFCVLCMYVCVCVRGFFFCVCLCVCVVVIILPVTVQCFFPPLSYLLLLLGSCWWFLVSIAALLSLIQSYTRHLTENDRKSAIRDIVRTPPLMLPNYNVGCISLEVRQGERPLYRADYRNVLPSIPKCTPSRVAASVYSYPIANMLRLTPSFQHLRKIIFYS